MTVLENHSWYFDTFYMGKMRHFKLREKIPGFPLGIESCWVVAGCILIATGCNYIQNGGFRAGQLN